MRARTLIPGLLTIAALGGCECGDGPTRLRDTGGGGELDAYEVEVDATVPPGIDAPFVMPDPDVGTDAFIDRIAFCMGEGPPVIVGDDTIGRDTCAGAIASHVFANSMCTCRNANVVGYLRTRSFDSGMGMGDDAYGAPVGINRDYLTGGYADVGGSFVVAGTMGVRFGGYLDVGGDARFAGEINAAGYIHIRRDLWVGGNVTNIGLLEVDRDVHQPSGRTLATFPRIDGSHIREPVTVEPPCDCSPTGLVDIAGIVAHGMTHNDNADVDLDPTLLENVVGLGVDITLPCGRYYLTSVGGLGDITIHVPGRTALFIGGDVDAIGAFDIDLGPDGELDMFIGGRLLSIGAGSYGDRARPARTRIYVGGRGDVTLVGASGFVGNVYAPFSRITAPGATTVYGSLFGDQIDMPGYLEIKYDRAILEVDEDCPPPDDGGCDVCGLSSCTDSRACVGGMCGSCTGDADCCAPLVCYPDGTCGPLLL